MLSYNDDDERDRQSYRWRWHCCGRQPSLKQSSHEVLVAAAKAGLESRNPSVQIQAAEAGGDTIGGGV